MEAWKPHYNVTPWKQRPRRSETVPAHITMLVNGVLRLHCNVSTRTPAEAMHWETRMVYRHPANIP